jgi:phosphoserine phosphatase
MADAWCVFQSKVWMGGQRSQGAADPASQKAIAFPMRISRWLMIETYKFVFETALSMNKKRRLHRSASFILRLGVLLMIGAASGVNATRPASAQGAGPDPLPSWNDCAAKRGILDFVARVTKAGGPDFVPVPDRIATFDNDGTLWAEKPLPVEVYFTLDRLRDLAARNPGLKERQPFKAALEGDTAFFREAGEKAVVELILATHTGMTQDQFAAEARQFFESERHPKLNRPFTEIAYQPMIELLGYLRQKGFQIWLCSGGTIDFMRVISQRLYGVPIDQVIGSEFKRESRIEGDRLVVWRLPEIDAVDDKEGKPVGIDRQIGKRPIFVAGNVFSGGDIAMMRYSKGRAGPSFQLLINHDDAEREFAYSEKNDESLDAAKRFGFTVANIKSDWKTIFVPGQAASAK